MKTILLFGALLLAAAPPARAKTQASPDDQVAIMILDRMADVIGDLHACSFQLETMQDVLDAESGAMVKRHASHEVALVGPDKMLVNSRGSRGHRGYWYDGTAVIYFSYDENNYARISAPPTIVEAIDSLHNAYGIDFPAADFIYPTFVTDLIAQSDRIDYLGTVVLGNKECFHIVAKGAEQDVQIWIANDATTLPVKYLIREKANGQVTEFEGTFSGWQLNPDLPSTIFTFLPPPGAKEVRMLARTQPPTTGGRR